MPLIELRDIRKTYTLGEVEVQALCGVSLDIDRGEYVALMGPSGSGKSTLMNTLGCLDRPTSGSYLLDGEEVVTMSQDDRARLRNHKIGFVFQNFNLLSRTSALENVELPMLYSGGMSGRRRHAAGEELLERVGLGDRMDHHPSQLSGGQQQRVAIARALANEPSILLADEPTGNLDSRTSREVMELFRQLNEQDGLTVIVVTHDQDVARHARRAIVIRDGQVVSDSTDFRHAVAALHGDGAETPAEPGAAPADDSWPECMKRLFFWLGRSWLLGGLGFGGYRLRGRWQTAAWRSVSGPRPVSRGDITLGGQFHGHRATGQERADRLVRVGADPEGVCRLQFARREGQVLAQIDPEMYDAAVAASRPPSRTGRPTWNASASSRLRRNGTRNGPETQGPDGNRGLDGSQENQADLYLRDRSRPVRHRTCVAGGPRQAGPGRGAGSRSQSGLGQKEPRIHHDQGARQRHRGRPQSGFGTDRGLAVPDPGAVPGRLPIWTRRSTSTPPSTKPTSG